ncbi:NEDD4-binding protein 2-like 1 [Polyodon spathula]|uniref:NEDD4-binding protein 2-like 1 n=1 Tax=Polyodon spathula TaxID=7913 RepID=UPI001B7F0271|nr:NEDD4-binding protein 2-like 1 [Polyodon spathula]
MGDGLGRHRNRPHLYILRGPSGSGKKQLAEEILRKYEECKYEEAKKKNIFRAFDYFIKGDNVYFDESKLDEAHAWNKIRAKEAMRQKIHPVIIVNTNIHLWEMKPYFEMGLRYKYHIRVREPRNYNVDELYRYGWTVPEV